MTPLVDVVVDSASREMVRAEIPLSSKIDAAEARTRLGVPAFVDLSDPLQLKAILLLYAVRSVEGAPRIALFGGTAHRLLSPSANDPASGLCRPLHDVDLACLHREIRPVLGLLRNAGERFGSRLLCFETPGDRTFNSLSGGRRYRMHDLRASTPESIELGTIDLIADEFRFCHGFGFAPELRRSPPALTLSPALLLLAKLQAIRRIPAEDAARVPERVLEPFGRHEVVIGLEAKDVRDVLSLLHDLAWGEGPREISREELVRHLAPDWGFWNTVRLNLGMIERSPILAELPAWIHERIAPALGRLQAEVGRLTPRHRFGFLRSQWWTEVDEPSALDSPAR